MSEFPSPLELRIRVEQGLGISFEYEKAKPLLVPYPKGEASRRYYQDAAIRAALEKIATGRKRLLLYLATGSGKTFIAVNLLKKLLMQANCIGHFSSAIEMSFAARRLVLFKMFLGQMQQR